MTLCTECKRNHVPALATRTSKVNAGLSALPTYWNTRSEAMDAVNTVLESNGFDPATVEAYNPLRSLHTEVGDGKWLSVSLYRMESGRYELVAYVN